MVIEKGLTIRPPHNMNVSIICEQTVSTHDHQGVHKRTYHATTNAPHIRLPYQ